MSAPAIFKAFVIRSFFPKQLSCLCFGMSCFKNLPACSAGSGFRSSDTGIMERLNLSPIVVRTVKLFPRFQTDCRQPPSREACAAVDGDVVIFFINIPGIIIFRNRLRRCMSCYQICIRKVFLLIIWSGPYKIVQGIFLDPLFRCESTQPPCTSRYCFSPTVSSSYRLKSSRKFSTSSRISDPAPEIPGS